MKAPLISFIFFALAFASQAQSPTGRSTGADGALVLTTPGTVVFDPRSFNPPLNPSADNIFQFTTIRIGAGVTVKLSSKNFTGPIFWLAQGPVEIDGTIDLSGDEGGPWPSVAGAGGYPGGAPQKPGYGPTGFTPNSFLVPLVGGSGGNGGKTRGGGAGGGALLIASDTFILVHGKIIANGGASLDGSGGNGGAVRLVAPVIDGSDGVLSVRGGQPGGGDGAVRFEANENRFSGTVDGGHVFQGKPLGLFLPPTPPPSVRIESIDGLPTNGQELILDKPSSIRIGLEARNIPTSTAVNLRCFSQDGEHDSTETSPLIGTEEHSRAIVLVLLPRGKSRCFAVAIWKNSTPLKP